MKKHILKNKIALFSLCKNQSMVKIRKNFIKNFCQENADESKNEYRLILDNTNKVYTSVITQEKPYSYRLIASEIPAGNEEKRTACEISFCINKKGSAMFDNDNYGKVLISCIRTFGLYQRRGIAGMCLSQVKDFITKDLNLDDIYLHIMDLDSLLDEDYMTINDKDGKTTVEILEEFYGKHGFIVDVPHSSSFYRKMDFVPSLDKVKLKNKKLEKADVYYNEASRKEHSKYYMYDNDERMDIRSIM